MVEEIIKYISRLEALFRKNSPEWRSATIAGMLPFLIVRNNIVLGLSTNTFSSRSHCWTVEAPETPSYQIGTPIIFAHIDHSSLFSRLNHFSIISTQCAALLHPITGVVGESEILFLPAVQLYHPAPNRAHPGRQLRSGKQSHTI